MTYMDGGIGSSELGGSGGFSGGVGGIGSAGAEGESGISGLLGGAGATWRTGGASDLRRRRKKAAIIVMTIRNSPIHMPAVPKPLTQPGATFVLYEPP